MNLKVEHGIIAILLLASLYYFYKHQSLVSDLLSVPDRGNQELKVVKGKHNLSIRQRVIAIDNCKYGDSSNYQGSCYGKYGEGERLESESKLNNCLDYCDDIE